MTERSDLAGSSAATRERATARCEALLTTRHVRWMSVRRCRNYGNHRKPVDGRLVNLCAKHAAMPVERLRVEDTANQ